MQLIPGKLEPLHPYSQVNPIEVNGARSKLSALRLHPPKRIPLAGSSPARSRTAYKLILSRLNLPGQEKFAGPQVEARLSGAIQKAGTPCGRLPCEKKRLCEAAAIGEASI